MRVPLHIEMSSVQGVGIEGGVLSSVGWDKGVPLYTEVSSFKGDRIEDSTVYRNALIPGRQNKVPL